MADEKKIIEISVDNEAAVAEIVRLREEVTKLNSQEGLTREEQEKNKIATKEYNDQIRSLQKEIQNSIKADQQKQGSLQQMKAQLSNLTKEYNNLSKEERESAKGTELRDKIKGLSDELKTNESAIGDNRRKVGDYAGEIGGLFGTLGKMPGAFGKMAAGAEGATAGFKALNATNPVGWITILIGIVTNLVAKFMDFAPVADFMTDSLAKLNAAFQVLKNGIIDVVTGQKSLSDAFKDTTSQMSAQVAEAERLSEATRDLEDRQEAMGVQQQRYRNEIDKLLLQSKNRTLSENERMALIDKALKIEEKAFKERKKLADDEVRLIQDKLIQQGQLSASEAVRLRVDGLAYARDIENRKNLKDAEIKALATALETQARIEGESIQLRERALNRRDQLEEQSEAARIKRQENLEKDIKKRAEMEEQSVKDAIYWETVKQLELEAIRSRGLLLAQKTAREATEKIRIDSLNEMQQSAMIELDAQYALKQSMWDGLYELQRWELEKSYNQQIQAAEKVGADTTEITRLYEKQKTEIKRLEVEAGLELAAGFMGNIAEIFGENTKVGKMAASAQVAIDSIKGAISAYSSLAGVPFVGPALGAAAAGAVIAAGVKSISKIWAVKSGLPGDSSGRGVGLRLSETAMPKDITSKMASPMSSASGSVSAYGGASGIASAPATSIATGGNSMTQAIQNMPAPIVTVKDIEIAQKRVKVVDSISKI